MCGIVYSHDFTGKPVNNMVMQQFDKQRTRGTQGFGIFDGQFGNMVHAAKEDKILKWLVKYDSSLLLMHHRFPTSTINVARAAHPFSTKKYFGKTQYILVHNGTIRNDFELFEEHQELGIEYYSLLQDMTFNDSEALLWDFALTMEGKQKELKVEGGIAFVCLKLVKGKLEKMYFARNYSSPLKMTRTKEGISLASELEDGKMVDTDTLYTWNYKLKRLTTRKMKIPTYIYKGSYTAPAYSSGRDYYTYQDCNCSAVGWANCVYHADYDDPHSWDNDGDKWNYRQDRNEERIGNKIGNTLKEQFGQKFGLIPRSKIQYEQDPKTQMMLPVGTKVPVGSNLSDALNLNEQRRIAEDKLILAQPITEDEVTGEYMAYLAGAKGHFEQAYWALEVDYETALNTADTKENIRSRRLVEKVMQRIENDPEYTDEEAVSNVWEAIWKAQK